MALNSPHTWPRRSQLPFLLCTVLCSTSVQSIQSCLAPWPCCLVWLLHSALSQMRMRGPRAISTYDLPTLWSFWAESYIWLFEGRDHDYGWACARTLLKPKLLVHFCKRIPVSLKQSGPGIGPENPVDRAQRAAMKNGYWQQFPQWGRAQAHYLHPGIWEHDSGIGTRASQSPK